MSHFVVTDRDATLLDDAVRRVLLEAGFRVKHRPLLELLALKGARVDSESERVRFSHDLIDEVIARSSTSDVRGSNPAAQTAPSPPSSPETFSVGFGGGAPFLYDYETGETRHPTSHDPIELAKLAHALPEVQCVSAPVCIWDVDPFAEPLEAFRLLVAHTDKPVSPHVVGLSPGHNPYFAELGELFAHEGPWNRWVNVEAWLPSPLSIGRRQVELLAGGAAFDRHEAFVGTMAVAGMTAPITQAGAIVMGAAEVLGGFICALALRPDITRLVGLACTGVVDPRTMRVCFGAPENIRQDVGLWELFNLRYGGGLYPVSHGYTDARVPGLQAAFEKVHKACFVARAMGTTPRLGNLGLLDGDRVFSPVQYLLDIEMDRALWSLHREMTVSPDTVQMDTILEATAANGCFLGMQASASHFRQSLWLPDLFDRDVGVCAADWRSEKALLDQANQRWREVTATYRMPARDTKLLEAVEEVCARGRKELTTSPAK